MAISTIPTADDVADLAVDEKLPFADVADRIAGTYHDLSRELESRLGSRDLTWCGYAKWTAQAIGVSLRLERTSPFWASIRRAFHVPTLFGGLLRRMMLRLLGGTYSPALSLANRSIFLEMGTFSVNYLHRASSTHLYKKMADLGDAQAFVHQLIGKADDRYLLSAANLYLRAELLAGAKPDLRSQLILGANVALSAFEQKRAQPALEMVLYRPVRWALVAWWRRPLQKLRRKPFSTCDLYLEEHADQNWFIRRVEAWWSRLYTNRVLAITTPISEVRVGHTLNPPQDPNQGLLGVDITAFDPDVATLIKTFHKDPARRLDGTTDWVDYDDRMRFITSYFMAYQNVEEMRDKPGAGSPPTSGVNGAPAHIVGRIIERCSTGAVWVKRRVRVPRLVDPCVARLENEQIRPLTVEIGRIVTAEPGRADAGLPTIVPSE